MPKPPAQRRRDAAATRAAILASARRAFAEHGYDGAGVREIAAGAGVTAMLVNRYFGSKEKLFGEAAADTMARPHILTAENLAAPDAAQRMARKLVEITGPGAPTLDGFALMLKSAANPKSAEVNRVEIERQHQRILAAALRGRHAQERAALALSLVAGVQLLRQTIGLAPLAKADPKLLVTLLEPLLEKLIDG